MLINKKTLHRLKAINMRLKMNTTYQSISVQPVPAPTASSALIQFIINNE